MYIYTLANVGIILFFFVSVLLIRNDVNYRVYSSLHIPKWKVTLVIIYLCFELLVCIDKNLRSYVLVKRHNLEICRLINGFSRQA